MSDYKVIHGGVVRMNDKDCGFTGMTNRAIVMRFNKLEAENAELKALIGYCITDMYKPSGKISKPTAIKLMKYMSDNNLLKH